MRIITITGIIILTLSCSGDPSNLHLIPKNWEYSIANPDEKVDSLSSQEFLPLTEDIVGKHDFLLNTLYRYLLVFDVT